MENVLITGGSGLIGQELSRVLSQKGYKINHLTRKKDRKIPYNQYIWDVNKNQLDEAAIENISFIVHLAGTNVSDKRWTLDQKLEIEKSRVQSTELLYEVCKKRNIWPKAFISSSAIGYYGSFNSEIILSETNSPGNDFLAQICEKWENAADLFANQEIRTVKIRTGVVLSKKGGAYLKIAKTVKTGLGSSLGSGNQYVPWIHISDIVNLFSMAIENQSMNGPYNGVAPQHITNKQFTKAIAKSLNKPMLMPNVPAFILKAAFGEMSDILLKGCRISSDKIINQGFKFRFDSLDKALENLAQTN